MKIAWFSNSLRVLSKSKFATLGSVAFIAIVLTGFLSQQARCEDRALSQASYDKESDDQALIDLVNWLTEKHYRCVLIQKGVTPEAYDRDTVNERYQSAYTWAEKYKKEPNLTGVERCRLLSLDRVGAVYFDSNVTLDDARVQALAKYCPNIERITLSGVNREASAAILANIDRFRSLVDLNSFGSYSVNIADPEGATEEESVAIAESWCADGIHFPETLRYLTFSMQLRTKSRDIYMKRFASAIATAKSLKHLTLSNQIDEELLEHFMGLMHLESFAADNNSGITCSGERFTELLRSLPKLEVFCCSSTIGRMKISGTIDWAEIGTNVPLLKELYLAGPEVTDEQVRGIAALESLEKLSLRNVSITNKSLHEIALHRRIESLKIDSSTLENPDVYLLQKMPKLKEVNGVFKDLDVEEFRFFAKLKNSSTFANLSASEETTLDQVDAAIEGGVRSLNIRSLRSNEYWGGAKTFGVTAYGYQVLPNGNLKRIEIKFTREQLGRSDFSKLENLETISIDYSRNRVHYRESFPTFEEYRILSEAPNVKSLELKPQCEVTTAALVGWAKHPTLESLVATDVLLSGQAAELISSIPNLKTLSLTPGRRDITKPGSGWSDTQWNWQIAEDAIIALSKMKSLKSLTIDGSHCNLPASIRPIAGLADTLEELALINLSITGDHMRFISELKKLTSLEIEVDKPRNEYRYLSLGAIRLLARLEKLQKLTFKGVHCPEGANRENFDRIYDENFYQVLKTLPDLTSVDIDSGGSQRWADEFGIHFIGECSCSCMDYNGDTTPPVKPDLMAIEKTEDASKLSDTQKTIRRWYEEVTGRRPTGVLVIDPEAARNPNYDPEGRSYAQKREFLGAVRIKSPIEQDELTIFGDRIPPSVWQFMFHDLKLKRLTFIDAPPNLRLFGDSQIEKIEYFFTDSPASGGLAAQAKFLSGRLALRVEYGSIGSITVHGSRQLHRVSLQGCRQIDRLDFVGEFPELFDLYIHGCQVGPQYLSVPYSGDAPKFSFHSGIRSGKSNFNLYFMDRMKMLKLPGTAIPKTCPAIDKKFPWDQLVELDIRGTAADDSWLTRASQSMPGLKSLKVGGCENMTEAGKAAFRQARPNVKLDDTTLHVWPPEE